MEMRDDSRISIIIVNYNGRHFLGPCLSSVLLEATTEDEIIVVDNGSSDGSAGFIKESFPAVKVIESPVNLGFAGGNNKGVEAAIGDFIVLLNNDTVVHKGWLKGLVDEMQKKNVGCATSLIKTAGIPERYYEMNGSINFLGHNIMRVYKKPSDIFFPGGASMIFRKSIFGLPFDEDYFAYGEDVYFGFRARFMGFNVCHTNASSLDHVGSGTSSAQKSSFRTYYQERNRLLNLFLFFSPLVITKVSPLLLANCFAKCTASIVGMKYSLSGLLKAYSWLILNFRMIKKKRSMLLHEMKVHESEVIKMMTGKMTNGESLIGKVVNVLSLFYFRLVRLNVLELSQ